MDKFVISQGDTSPAIEAELQDSSGVPVPLDDATAEFLMRDENSNLVISETAFRDPNETGIVVYEWRHGDTSDPGVYRATWRVTYDDGAVETFPNSGYLTVYVTSKVE